MWQRAVRLPKRMAQIHKEGRDKEEDLERGIKGESKAEEEEKKRNEELRDSGGRQRGAEDAGLAPGQGLNLTGAHQKKGTGWQCPVRVFEGGDVGGGASDIACQTPGQ